MPSVSLLRVTTQNFGEHERTQPDGNAYLKSPSNDWWSTTIHFKSNATWQKRTNYLKTNMCRRSYAIVNNMQRRWVTWSFSLFLGTCYEGFINVSNIYRVGDTGGERAVQCAIANMKRLRTVTSSSIRRQLTSARTWSLPKLYRKPYYFIAPAIVKLWWRVFTLLTPLI